MNVFEAVEKALSEAPEGQDDTALRPALKLLCAAHGLMLTDEGCAEILRTVREKIGP